MSAPICGCDPACECPGGYECCHPITRPTPPVDPGDGFCRCPRWPNAHLPEHGCPETQDTPPVVGEP